MKVFKVFIDGSSGTTGLKINERLSERKDIQLISLPEENRKDIKYRRRAINEADIVFLCLPDAAAIEAVACIENENTAVIDTSTAHRVSDGWIYGFPEFRGMKEKIANSKKIANPGCHAGGFLALVRPLIEAGALPKDIVLSCFSLTGYSGGGKKMIEEYESPERPNLFSAPRQYALSQKHKHLPEMTKIAGLTNEPIFCPIVADFYSGMEVSVPLSARTVGIEKKEIVDIYKKYYDGTIVRYKENPDENGFLSAAAMSGRDDMEISVLGNEERFVLVSRFDNLGKGASGSAIQNMNILLGIDETTGLITEEDKT